MSCDPKLAWPDSRIAQLRDFWERGLSASQIAAKLGVSRSAVLGKADRLNLPERAPSPPEGSRRWPAANIQKLRELAAAGIYATTMAQMIGVSRQSLLNVAKRYGIEVQLNTPAEQAAIDEMVRAKHRRKHEKRKAARAEAPDGRGFKVDPGTSRTAPIYRNLLPRLPEMSKNELRAMLAQAVRNTAEMAA